METEKYFIVTNDDSPQRICFTYEDAVKNLTSGYYIDSFDANGLPVKSYLFYHDESDNPVLKTSWRRFPDE